MKTLFTLLLSGLVAMSAFAADATGRITVSFSGSKEYRISIDGRSYYSNDNRLYLNSIRPGRHQIEVYKVHRNNSRKSQRVYSGSFTVRPQYDMHITVDRNGRVEFNEQRTRYDRKDRGRNDSDWDRRDWDRDDRNKINNYSRAMSDRDFNEFLQKVRAQWLGKTSAAREGIDRNYFTTQQVRQLLQVFPSESDRLDLARRSHNKVVDQRNFTQLYDLFSRQAQMELEHYTQRARY